MVGRTKRFLDRYRFHGIKKKNLQPAWQTWERLNSSPTRQLRPATAGSKGAYYRIPRPGTSRPVIPSGAAAGPDAGHRHVQLHLREAAARLRGRGKHVSALALAPS